MHQIISMGKHSKTYNVALHDHNHWEVVYCTSGSGRFAFQDGPAVSYGKNEVVAIPPHTLHANLSDTGFTSFHLTFDASAFPFKAPIKAFDNENQHLLAALNQAFFFFTSDIENKDGVMTSLGDLIANYLISFASRERFSPGVEKLRAAIIVNFADPRFSIDRFMQNEPHNPDYLRKVFKKETGLSPLGFLTTTKMTFAKKLLANQTINHLNINEIASMCGYDDALYFSRVFKKQTGVSPKAYMEESQKEKD